MAENGGKWTSPARGCRDRRGYGVKTVCLFDEDTHAQIRQRAVTEGTSFAAQVRQLVDWGLMA